MDLTQATGSKDTSKTLRFHFESDSDYGFWSIIPISLISSFSLRVGFMVDIPDEATTYLISLAQSDSLSTLEVPHTLLLNRELMAQLSHFPALSELIFRSFPHDEESVIQLLAWLGFRERFGYRRLKELNMNGWGNGINPAIIHLLGQSVDSFTTSISERQMQIFRSQHLGHL
ncbi:hypothetical protein ONZ45_g2351 [Pleurotus djamor]|nr:hypothetical protein ONZ45_g2351 [Pleurotus djamor]